MTEKQQEINYVNEQQNLIDIESKNWWMPTTGQHHIEILDEGEPFDAEDFNKQPVIKVRYKINVMGKKYDWSVTKSKTKTGLWGQLVLCIAQNKYHAQGLKINLVIKGEGKARQYTILEALPLLQKKGV